MHSRLNSITRQLKQSSEVLIRAIAIVFEKRRGVC